LGSIYIILILLIVTTSVYCSIFALLADVFPRPIRYNWNSFYFDPDADIKKIAFIQIIIDLAVCVLGLFLL
jgi:hypothetical protein